MLTPFTQNHWHDDNDNPAGGCSFGQGFCISWQNGPLGRGTDRIEPNGAFVETVIKAVAGRIEMYQQSRFNCAENAAALEHLYAALESLDSRTQRREVAGVEGTHCETVATAGADAEF